MFQKISSMAVKFKEINEQIENDVNSAIESIEREMFFIIDSDLDFYFLKEFTKYYPRCLVRRKAEILLDTVLNYLISAALEEVRMLECEKQYEFFKLNLRNRIKKRVMAEYPERKLRPVEIEEKEPLLLQLLTALPGLLVAISGTVVTFVTSQGSFLSLLSATGSFLGLIYAFIKLRKRNRIKNVKKLWKHQVKNYLKSVKEDIKEWLHLALFEFSFEWEGFCGRSTGFAREIKSKPVEVIFDSQFQ